MFNTLKYVKMLEAAGFSREQSEVSIRVLAEVMEEKLATKQDIQELASATQHDIQELASATQRDFQDLKLSTQRDFQEMKASNQHDLRELESRLTLRVGTMLAASVTLLTAIVTAIHKFV